MFKNENEKITGINNKDLCKSIFQNNFFILIINMNYRFLDFLTKKINDELTEYFSKQRFPDLNKSIRTNFYALDAVGLPIRMKESDKHTLYGWKRYKGKFYHHLVDLDSVNVLSPEVIRKDTAAKIRARYQSSFLQSNNLMRKYIHSLYSDLG